MIRHKKIYPRITPLNPPEPIGRRKQRQLAGERPVDEQVAYLDRSQVDAAEPLTDTDIYEGELPTGDVEGLPGEDEAAEGVGLELLADIAAGARPASIHAELPEIENLELLADIYERQQPVSIAQEPVPDTEDLDLLTELELRAGETSDPLVASDEAATYMPPIDPPVIPGRAGSLANAVIASGLGISALDEPYDEAHHGDTSRR